MFLILGDKEQQSLGVYTPDSSSNSVHSMHSYNPGQQTPATDTSSTEYHTAVNKPGSVHTSEEYHPSEADTGTVINK